LEDIYAKALGRDRFLLTLIGAFAAIALMLAVVGVYSVTAEAAVRRTKEIGIRVALGATPNEIVLMILGQGLALAAAGIALGLVGAFAGARVLTSVLYGIASHDAMTFVMGPAMLALAAAVACAVPAIRAARLDPGAALRRD
jgi:ABC-type antimicrobial peptide transport system permease subunit